MGLAFLPPILEFASWLPSTRGELTFLLIRQTTKRGAENQHPAVVFGELTLVYSLLVSLPYLPLTLMILGLASSALGMVRVSTPFWHLASALSASTGTGRVTDRLNAP